LKAKYVSITHICIKAHNVRSQIMLENRARQSRYWVLASVVRTITLCSSLKVNRRFGGTITPIFGIEQAAQNACVKAGGKPSHNKIGREMCPRTKA
jgi:hypothetical protein